MADQLAEAGSAFPFAAELYEVRVNDVTMILSFWALSSRSSSLSHQKWTQRGLI
jgi:hypothetical protein